MLDKGQTMTKALSYAPLPKHVVEMEKAAITKQVNLAASNGHAWNDWQTLASERHGQGQL